MRLTFAAVRLCAAIGSPEDLADAFRLKASADLYASGELNALAEAYEPFSSRVAVIEEFAGSVASTDSFAISDELDARADAFRDEADRLARSAENLRLLADLVAFRYRGLDRFRVRAMRAECLAVLSDSE